MSPVGMEFIYCAALPRLTQWMEKGLLCPIYLGSLATCRPSALLSTAAKRTPALLNCSAKFFCARSTYAASRCCSVFFERGGSP